MSTRPLLQHHLTGLQTVREPLRVCTAAPSAASSARDRLVEASAPNPSNPPPSSEEQRRLDARGGANSADVRGALSVRAATTCAAALSDSSAGSKALTPESSAPRGDDASSAAPRF
eukprot:CAMPEP_0181253274 /NCGR_PEP_ID=MMETSP1096-20121128/47927_1 /TAXON_ID=156174 ORGANISM="Chrysochromulina ericina, Strain CCMP281" /NCGR_SAMPLE_ID=MMETSP1096 /ASSEMBLY_ACC=CAM_ASM_000453 /LENGTH=115 /DNA_ID=CAMNT_0023351121 /DNA_START=328 /DNA_END=672 /DNA_ORIENTATION=+